MIWHLQNIIAYWLCRAYEWHKKAAYRKAVAG